jgi:hypothetical protein
MIKFLAIFLMIITISCNSKSQNHDSQDSPDLHDSDKDTETIDETTDKTSDVPDETPDEEPDEAPDTPDENPVVECLDLRVQENVIKTPFPFKDKDGRPTFCRPGCDTPTENDPQCVRNIWEWDNWEKHQKYLAAQKADPEQTSIRECYPWPCKLPDMKGRNLDTLTSNCDKIVSGYGYSTLMGYVWTHGMSEGVAGMIMTLSGRAIEYDPGKDEYVTVGQARSLIYNRGRYVVEIYDQMPAESNFTNRQFVVSIERRDGEYYYELIYDNKDHNAFFSRPPFVGKDWVLIQVCEGSKGPCEVKYAKSDKWEWHRLNIFKVYEGNIVDDRLSFIIHDGTNDRQIFYCDMSKHPKSFHECTRVTRKLGSGGYELGHSPRIDEEDKNRLIYFIDDSDPQTFVEVRFEEGKEPQYKEYVIDHRMQPDKVKGDIMIYASSLGYSFINCWYRFDKNKSYCPTKSWNIHGGVEMLYGTFSDKWQLWKTTSLFLIRDWECYCKETGLCPFEE